ncbi:hypothetical protein FOA52_000207 [Chlamydomonas sp. UWO 241]|nr:hypothetical protein FOA52_000207 [Chlamydomonas sp. UWO 241]
MPTVDEVTDMQTDVFPAGRHREKKPAGAEKAVPAPGGEISKLPRKRFFRSRAHSNPLSDSMMNDVPGDYTEMDWPPHYPAFLGDKAPVPEDGQAPKVRFADVGCGFGGLLIRLSPLYPNDLMVGLELRDKVSSYVKERVAALRRENPGEYGNISCLRANAMKYLPHYFEKGQLTKMFFLFPDPHFKHANHRRRIINTTLISEYAYLMAPSGMLYTITDVKDLGDWMRAKLLAHPMFELISDEDLESDPAAGVLINATEEGQKVARNKGNTWRAVFRRLPEPRCSVRCQATGGEEDERAQSGVSSSQDVCVPAAGALAAVLYLAGGDSAIATDTDMAMAVYNNETSSEFLKNAAGVGYVLLVGLFLYRVLRRRAKRAKEEKISGQITQEEWDNSWFAQMRAKFAPPAGSESSTPVRDATAFDALLGAAQAAALGFGMFIFSSKMTVLIGSSPLPDGYQARNISITVRTLIEGLSWLATFVFCLNAVGLSALSVQMLMFPEKLMEDEVRAATERARRAAPPQLPKVGITASPEEMRAAFMAAEKMGKAEATAKLTAASGASNIEEVTPRY